MFYPSVSTEKKQKALRVPELPGLCGSLRSIVWATARFHEPNPLVSKAMRLVEGWDIAVNLLCLHGLVSVVLCSFIHGFFLLVCLLPA